MNIEDYNSVAKMFRGLTNNCIQLLKKVGVEQFGHVKKEGETKP